MRRGEEREVGVVVVVVVMVVKRWTGCDDVG